MNTALNLEGSIYLHDKDEELNKSNLSYTQFTSLEKITTSKDLIDFKGEKKFHLNLIPCPYVGDLSCAKNFILKQSRLGKFSFFSI